MVGESLRLKLDEQLLCWFLCEEEEEFGRRKNLKEGKKRKPPKT
jgi:hypothetical protein